LKRSRKEEIITVSKRIGDSTAIWFASSRSFVLLEQPAWEVFDRYLNDWTAKAIFDYVSSSYNLEDEDSQKFVNEIIEGIIQLNDPANLPYQQPELVPEFNEYQFPLFAEKFYMIGETLFRFRYGSEWLLRCFHPTMAHLETGSQIAEHLFEVFEQDGLLIFRHNGKAIEAFKSENSHYLRGAVSQKLFSVLYEIKDEDWMITLHSAAVSDGKSAIVFPAQAGSGKSTLSAILQAQGFMVLSDDFNAVNQDNGFVYRLPLAISVKEGSLKTLEPYYPTLKEILPEQAATGKIVRHLPVTNNQPGEHTAFPVKALVFMSYAESEPFIFEEIDEREAIQLLLPETWVNPTSENVVQFFTWIEGISFYRLQYAVNQDAITAIDGLFNA
jgi:hypothetical protein